ERELGYYSAGGHRLESKVRERCLSRWKDLRRRRRFVLPPCPVHFHGRRSPLAQHQNRQDDESSGGVPSFDENPRAESGERGEEQAGNHRVACGYAHAFEAGYVVVKHAVKPDT